MKMKPMGDMLLIKVTEEEKKTTSGILLTASQSGYVYGKVAAVGTGLFTQTGDKIPMTVQVGDTVLMQQHLINDGRKVRLENEEYALIRESELSMISTGE
jgi:chaperonin GroES